MAESNKKRERHESEDSEVNSFDSKRVRVELTHSEVNSTESNQDQDDSDNSVVNSPDVKLIREDLLDILDDSDTVTDRDPVIQDLDSVIKSFEEEILVQPEAGLDLTLNPGESQAELGYLLEASDDELGLPPSTASSSGGNNETKVVDFSVFPSNDVAMCEMLGFGGELPIYDSYGFGIGDESANFSNDDNGGDYVTLDRLFDYETTEFWESSYEAEYLPAL